MKKIDIHVHVRKVRGIPRLLSGRGFPIVEDIKSMYERDGIEKGVILPRCSPEWGNQMQSNEEALELVEMYPDLFYWFCDIDPRMGANTPDADLSYFLAYYKKLGAKGVGEITCNLNFDDPYVENLFYHCEKNSMPVLFHIGPRRGGCYGLVDSIGLPGLEKELAKFPNLIFLGHSQPFWAEIGSGINTGDRNGYPKGKVNPGRVVELMRRYPNLFGDLSAFSGYNAMSRDPEFGYSFIEEFQDRLLFGTDFAVPDQESKLSFWLDEAFRDGKISKAAYEKVSRNNALKLLGE